jgi:neutral ceramidase
MPRGMSTAVWKAGAASIAITPTEPMWLAGWAARREPASGKATELFAKALALEDTAGARAVIVTADLIAIPRTLADAVAARVQLRHGLPRERTLFNASHTHTGPEVRPDKVPFFEIPAELAAKIPPYVAQLERRLVELIETALGKLAPATLHVHQATAGFAANRRSPAGPVDHDVPILAVRDSRGKTAAIVFGYACHNLTLPPAFCAYHGDYAGLAQLQLEEKFPGATALFLAGAGADQDPAPRGTLELAQAHGTSLATAVERALHGKGREVAPQLGVVFEDVALDLQPLPAVETLQADVHSDDPPRRRKARYLLDALAAGRALAVTQPCPVHVLRFGAELLLIALGGEPVVDFALQFKRAFEAVRFRTVWVAGYSNDMFGYLPTVRVQREGGYEAGRAALWSALPTSVADSSEERVLAATRRLVDAAASGR